MLGLPRSCHGETKMIRMALQGKAVPRVTSGLRANRRVADIIEGARAAGWRYSVRPSAIVLVAGIALACGGVCACWVQAGGGSGIEGRMRSIIDGDADINDDAGVLTSKVRCNVAAFGEGFCLQSSIIMYPVVRSGFPGAIFGRGLRCGSAADRTNS
jgi:hypothetical protein